MKLFNILAAGTVAGLFASTAFAASDAVINSVAQQLAAQGYTKIHVVNSGTGMQIVASGPNGQLQANYDNTGNQLSSSTGAGTGTTGGTGNTGGLVDGVVGTNNNTTGADNMYGDNDGDREGAGDDDDHGNSLFERERERGHSGSGSHREQRNGGRDSDHNGGRDNDDHGGRDNDD
ncbi:MAG: hypothetical protein P8X66_02985 [Maritimibacter sp.]